MKKKIQKVTKTRVTAIQCPKCKDIIYSRAHHDFHWCSCKTVAIDGGFDYVRIIGNEKIKTIIKYIPATRTQLYKDWNYNENKFGVIKNVSTRNKTKH